MATLSISGDLALQKALDNLRGPQIGKAMSKGLRAGGKITLARIRGLVPKDTGLLKKSISLRVGKRNRKGTKSMVIMVNAKRVDEIKASSGKVAEGSKRHRSGKGKVDDKYYYPAAQEFGWTKGGRYYPGKPHFRPGFDQTKERADVTIQQMIWRQILIEWSKPQGK